MNKIDAVRFEFTNVQKYQSEEIFGHELKLYEFDGNDVKTVNDDELILAEGVKEWGSDGLLKTYWELKDEFKEKRFGRSKVKLE